MRTTQFLPFSLSTLVFLLALSSTAHACQDAKRKTATVTVSAYNSVASQTQGKPNKTAWGDTLKPGMKAIAVSRDLIKQGLTHNTAVRIEGLDAEYRVLDKLAKRWKKKVDIYMGTNVKRARQWGKKKLTISWCPK